VHDTKVQIAGGEFRQLVVKDLGHEQPTVLVTNDRKTSAAKVIARYARRMLIENALSDVDRGIGGHHGSRRRAPVAATA
jgi:hypothetical protein